MRIAAVAVLLVSLLLEHWVRHRAFRFLRYQGESRIRVSRNLTHLAAEHYLPEGVGWLRWLRVATAVVMVAFVLAFWAVVSS